MNWLEFVYSGSGQYTLSQVIIQLNIKMSHILQLENDYIYITHLVFAEADLHSCSYKKVFLKYEANLQENTHVKVRFQ